LTNHEYFDYLVCTNCNYSSLTSL